jgi:hypothetical protein
MISMRPESVFSVPLTFQVSLRLYLEMAFPFEFEHVGQGTEYRSDLSIPHEMIFLQRESVVTTMRLVEKSVYEERKNIIINPPMSHLIISRKGAEKAEKRDLHLNPYHAIGNFSFHQPFAGHSISHSIGQFAIYD